MLRIGDFSRLSQVSIKTLRFYDQVGLLKPAQVDRSTGYRYYSLDQLPRLNRILALKDLGLSLEQIAQILDTDLQTDDIRAMLRLKLAELQQELAVIGARLTRVESRLRQIDMEDKMSDQEIILKKVEAQRVLSLREIVPANHERLFEEMRAAVQQYGIHPTAPWLAMYHHAGYRDRDLDLEVAVPVSESVKEGIPLSSARQLTIRIIPAIETVICAVSRGNYDKLGAVYTALTKYIHENGYNYLGPAREVYLRGPGDTDDPNAYLTEIQYPIGEFQPETVIDGTDVPEGWKDTRSIRASHLPFTRRARTALSLAENESATLHQAEVAPVHLLLALIRESEGFAGHVLGELGISLEQARTLLPVGTSTAKPQVTDVARQIVNNASQEARQLGHNYIGTEHLLLGLLQGGDKVVLDILNTDEATPDQVRAAVLETLHR